MTRAFIPHEPSDWCQAIGNAVHVAHVEWRLDRRGTGLQKPHHEAFTILGAQCSDMRKGLHWHAYRAISGHWRKVRTDGQIEGWLFL